MVSKKFRVLAMIAAVAAICGSAFADKGVTPGRSPKAFQDPRPRIIPSKLPVGGFGELTHTFSSFNQVVTNEAGSGLGEEAVQLTGAPAGIYTGYTVSVDWSEISGTPWSNEAIWAFTDANSALGSSTFYADPGPAPNSAPNGSPVTLSWSGFMDTPYDTAGGPLWYLLAQTFESSSANWNNISITINDSAPVAPPSTATILGGMLSEPLGQSEVNWYAFDYSGSGAFTIDTIGSDLPGGSFGDNDTEIGLYSSLGALIDTNDDIDIGAGNLFSSLSFADGELPAGRYYLAAGAFNTNFGPAFAVTSTSTAAGTLKINGLQVPEPATVTSVVIAALALLRLRRR